MKKLQPNQNIDQNSNRVQRALNILTPMGFEHVYKSLDHCGQIASTFNPSSVVAHNEIRTLLETGKVALERAASNSTQWGLLSNREIDGLESIVVAVGRPAILIRNDHFDNPPTLWQTLEEHRSSIERVIQSVGRIELSGHPSLEWAGTGFLIAPGVIATNRHVVQEFAQIDWQGHWSIGPNIKVSIDFAEELGSQQPREFPINAIIGVHNRLDVALLRIDDAYWSSLPLPLLLDSGTVPLAPEQKTYVIGYPALDSRQNDPNTLQRIFNDIYNVKRLQPGLLRDWSAEISAYMHDCSTLGGNSGSCFVDLVSGCVIGIHFGGRFGVTNWAHSIRDLASDPTLLNLGANFAT